MTIGQLARQGGVNVETIRYYQRRGLLPVPPQSASAPSEGRVRRYDEAVLRRLRFIKSAQAAGFTLTEIAELLELDASSDRKWFQHPGYKRWDGNSGCDIEQKASADRSRRSRRCRVRSCDGRPKCLGQAPSNLRG